MKGSVIRAAVQCALLAAACLAAPALAQSGARLINTPAEKFAMAPGGVDMRTGRYAYSETDLAIGGAAGNGGLVLTRTMTQNVDGHVNPFANLSHNWDIMITELRININNPSIAGNDYRMIVNFGGRSQTYEGYSYSTGFAQKSDGGYAPLTYAGDRTTASVVYTYSAVDGTVVEFRPLGGGDCSSTSHRRCAFVSRITEADGTVYSFDYVASGTLSGGAQRLALVTSSRGYALLLEGSGNLVTKACVLNLTQGPVPPNGLCPAGAPATASYAYTGGNARIASVTGPDGAVASFTYGSGTMGFVRPGETTPWLTNGLWQLADEDGIQQEIVSAQSFADGQSYAYSSSMSPMVSYHQPTIAGGWYTDALGQMTTFTYAWPFAQGANNPGSPCTPQWPPCPPPAPDDFMNWVYQQTSGPVEITDALGRTTTFDYCDPVPMAQLPPNEGNRCVVVPLVSFTDPEGARTELEYDGHRNITKVTRHPRPGSTLDPIVTSAVYDIAHPRSSSKPLSMTDANGNTTNYSYAPEHGGLLTETGPAPIQGAPRPQTRHEYGLRQARRSDGSAAGPPVWVRTATSLCRTSAATGNPAAPCTIAGDGVRTTYDYGPDSGPNNLLLRGQAVTATDNGAAATLRTCYAYDALGRKISETQPAANLASCPAGPPTTALPYTSSTRYDANGRVTGTIAPDSGGAGGPRYAAVRNIYDAAGRQIRVEHGTLAAWQSEAIAPAGWSGFTIFRTIETAYDMISRKTRESLREGSAGAVRTLTQYSYDLAGRPECTAIRMNPAAFGALPSSACTLGTQGSHGPDRITRNVYDAAGQRLQLREGVGSAVEAAEATWAYNLNGQITTVLDGNGNRAQLHYDGHGRQDRWTFPSATRPAAYNDATQATALATAGSVNAGDYEAYSYDPNGNRTNLRKRDTRDIAFAYDALNRVTAKTYPQGGATPVHYSYDLRNLHLSARFSSQSGEGLTNTYNGFGRMVSSSANMGGVIRTLTYAYDANGNRTRIIHPDGLWFDLLHDGLNRPIFLSRTSSFGLAFTSYSPNGLPSGTSRGNDSLSPYDYDGIQRLNYLGHWFPNAAGNGLWTYARNPAGQIAGITSYTDLYAWPRHYAVNRNYTTDGLNRYSAVGPLNFEQQYGYDANGNLTSDGARTYSYDIENRLVGSGNLTLAYDPLGRLFQTSGTGLATTRYLYDGDALVAEYDGAGLMTHRYVHWAGADVPMVSYAGADLAQPSYLYADHQGSIVAVANANGQTITPNSYDEYGFPAVGNVGRFQYTGQIWIPELGMYHYKARIYSPPLGRFLQTDPIGYDDQFNLYAYVGNDPVNNVDPTGQQTLAAIFEIPAIQFTIRVNPLLGVFVVAEGLAMSQMPPRDRDNPPTLAGNIPASDRRVSRNDNGGPPLRPRGQVAAPPPTGNGEAEQAGRYEFPDRQAGDVPYVGQSGNMPRRLGEHERAGRMTPGTARTTPVSGGRTAREVSEHRRIRELTGGQPARSSPNVSNQRDPVGRRRRGLLDD